MCIITICMKKWWLSHRHKDCHYGDYWRLPKSYMATSYITAATLFPFLSAIIIIKFDLRLSSSKNPSFYIHSSMMSLRVCSSTRL